MSESALIGIDLGKHSFHLHGQDKLGREVFRKKLSRQQMMTLFGNLPACTVVMEACAGAHFVARQLMAMGHEHFCYLDEQIKALDKELASQLADDDLGSRLLSLPCVGPITASLLAVEVRDGQQYKCSRDFAASVGLVPRQYSTGGRANLLGISKRGDKHLRQLLVQCARVYMQRLEHQKGALADWVRSLLGRRHSNVVACALANKLARIAWALAAHHTQYEAGPDALNA
ncbi:IS110 family transposase [Pseudomonas cucumis]|uniref:IS110 family transposase n=1 Tax=Pseudomonas cucumis TaxID=2954082 RepID=A0ABY9F0R7_9PSED|nr:IS110 family transposase [Pseudomonas cucumis]WLG86520.1 IS110 family transposase [Pseudomonas cucumis]